MALRPRRYSRPATPALTVVAALFTTSDGDEPLARMRWWRSNCGSRLTEFIVADLRTFDRHVASGPA